MMAELIYTARASGDRLRRCEIAANTTRDHGDACIQVDPGIHYQEIIGFGGAFTDTAAGALLQMNTELRERALASYYDPDKGLGYNIGRVPIGACDFSRELYSHDDTADDIELTHYSVDHDHDGIIPLITAAQSHMRHGEELYLYALPWSPPAWMKTNGEMQHGGRLRDDYYEAMARYIIRFVDAYAQVGIPIRGITAQNEPDEVQEWPSCLYSHEEERRLLRCLEPEATRRHLDILCWDSNRPGMRARAEYLMQDPVLQHAMTGVAFHGYSKGCYEELDRLHEEFPQLTLCATEYCTVMADAEQDWVLAERYALDMIRDLNHWTSLWIDWNLYLDENSGPKFVENPCSAPIILNAREQEILYTGTYYYIAHFSRYIRRGARRIHLVQDENSGIRCCAFENPDSSVVVVVLNDTEVTRTVEVGIRDSWYTARMEGHSVGTLRVVASE